MKSTGVADLPLHGGKAPRWLFQRMVKLSGAITETILDNYGQEVFLERITDPYWFQALACTIGFDWHSSGTTTTTCGALKVALDPEEHGLAILGGKGAASRKTPDEIMELEEFFSLRPSFTDELIRNSKLAAKVDNSCIQDDYQLYHHSFIVTEKGDWGVVQQGMKGEIGAARRYHWISKGIKKFVEEPHKGICGDRKETGVLDMTSRNSNETRKISIDLVKDGPEHLRPYLSKGPQTSLTDFTGDNKRLKMPAHHPVLEMDITPKGWDAIRKAYEVQPDSYEELVMIRGMGPKKIRALALVADLVHGSEASWEDPVKYSFAHGGKDGTPFPVDREVYDSTIKVLKEDLKACTVENEEKRSALKRLQRLL
ncbi:MAG: DUF763 domain-containing protein [Thermoplasmata archaeon]